MKLNEAALNNCFSNSDNKKNYNRDLFSLIAPKYNKATRLLSLCRDQAWKNKLIQLLPKIKNPKCLDLACGTGDVTFKVAQNYSDGKIYGLDITPCMIEEAKKLNKFKNIEFVCSDMCETFFENNSFDVITASYALRNSPDLKKALTEVNRILKPGGTLAILDFCKYDNKIAQKFEYFVLKLWGNFLGLVLHKNHTIYGYIAESIKYHPTQSEFERLLRDFNFEIINKKNFYFGVVQVLILKKEINGR